MRSNYERQVAEQTEIERRVLQGNAVFCASPFGRAWKALFPFKASEELALRAGMSKRAADYQLSGEHDPSAQSILALIEAVTPRRKK